MEETVNENIKLAVSRYVPEQGIELFNLAKQQKLDLTPSGNEDTVWLEPALVCVVQYMPNEKGLLRQPVLKGIRVNKSPLECQENQ